MMIGGWPSSVGAAVSEALQVPYIDGDDLHPAENVAKMRDGIPLTDDDRWPWLDAIVDWTAAEDAQGHSTIVTCSALKRIYRDRLRAAPGTTVFLHLTGSQELLGARMSERTDHFMPPTLLPSQFATLEPLAPDEAGHVIDIDRSVDEIIQACVDALEAEREETR